jgi:hypothetical protein
LDQTAILEAGDEIIVPDSLLHKWMDLFAPGTPMLCRLTNVEKDLSRIVCVGSSDQSNAAYVPCWILEHLGYALDKDEQVFLSPYLEEIPSAQRISLRPLDNAAYHTDLRQAFETYLDRFHVMEAGTTLSLPLEELGGYEVCSFVEAVEPPGIVRLGGEVQIEFLEPEGGIPEHEEVVPENTVTNPVVSEEVGVAIATPTNQDNQDAIRQARIRFYANLNKNV